MLCKGNEVYILGCGNPLFGDDGFGPAVIDYFIKEYGGHIKENVIPMDMGTSVRDFLFDIILMKEKPKKIIIVDSHNQSGRPGEIREISLDEISPKKISDFSLHQFPTTNLLKELKENTSIEIKVFVCEAKNIPSEVSPGLSEEVREAIPKMCKILLKECEG